MGIPPVSPNPHYLVEWIAFCRAARALKIIDPVSSSLFVNSAVITVGVFLIIRGVLSIPNVYPRLSIEQDCVCDASIVP